MDASTIAGTGDVSLEALSVMLEAWDEAADRGVAPEMIAYAALFTALTDLVGAFGENAVADLTRGLAERIARGEFSLSSAPRTKQ